MKVEMRRIARRRFAVDMSDVVLVALIAAVPSTLAAVVSLLNHQKIANLEIRVNGRLTELLALTATSSHAEGKLDKS